MAPKFNLENSELGRTVPKLIPKLKNVCVPIKRELFLKSQPVNAEGKDESPGCGEWSGWEQRSGNRPKGQEAPRPHH